MQAENKKQSGYRALRQALKTAQLRENETSAANAELSARIAVLEKEKQELAANIAALTALIDDPPPPDYEAIAKSPDFIENYAVRSPKLCECVVKSYLKSLASVSNVNVISGGAGVTGLTPHAKPTSLAEAKKLAKIIIKG